MLQVAVVAAVVVVVVVREQCGGRRAASGATPLDDHLYPLTDTPHPTPHTPHTHPQADAVSVMPVTIIFQCVGLKLGGAWIKRFGPKVASLMGCAIG